MGVITDHYLNSFKEKFEEFSHRWEQSSFKESLEIAYNFDFQDGEIVEVEEDEELYEITDRMPAYSIMTGQDMYMADRLRENHDGNLQRTYENTILRGEEIQ